MTPDLRLALRRLAKEPGLATAAILTLAVGIGASTAMFSLVRTVLLRSFGVTAPERLVIMWPQFGDTAGEFSYNAYRDLRRDTNAFERMAVRGSVTWSGDVVFDGGKRVRAAQAVVSADFFDVLGAAPLLGRTFRVEDDAPGARPVVVLSGAFWRKYFGADRGAVGRPLMLREKAGIIAHEIVGVMPAEYFYPHGADYWTPAAPALARSADPGAVPDMLENLGVFHLVGRPKPGVSIAAAQADASRAWKARAEKRLVDGGTLRIAAAPFLDHVFGRAREALVILMGAVLLVLFVACANVAGLMLARGAARTREVVVRTALGATRWQLSRQLLAEAGVIAIIGGTLGVSFAPLGIRAVIALSPAVVPRLDTASVDATVMVFALLATVVTTLFVGLAPSWQLRLRAGLSGLQSSSTGVAGGSVRAGVRQALVVTQVAIALVLLVASALTVRSVSNLARLDLGFDPSNVLTFEVGGLDDSRYPTSVERHALVDRLLERFDRLPEILASAAVLSRPFAHGVIGWDSSLLLPGQADIESTWVRNPTLNFEAVTPRYFQSMGVRLLRGRHFSATDRKNAPLVAIVSEGAAARIWPGVDAVGQRLVDSFIGHGDGKAPPRWATVVGVVADARYREVDHARIDLYMPLAQTDFEVEHFVLRTAGDPRSATSAVAAEVSAVDAGLSIEEPTTMEEVIQRVVAPWHFNMILFSMFGAVSAALTAVGIFGLVAYAVAWRRREIGVRIALGAQRRDVVGLIVFQGLKLVVIGLTIGLAVSLAATRLMRGVLFGVSPTDPRLFALAATGLVLLTCLACYIPARRAAGLDPSIAFRDE